MSVKNIRIILSVISAIVNLSISNAQQFIGILGGCEKGTFWAFANKRDYDAKYHLKNGAAFSSFYETKMDSTINLKIELQYQFQSGDMEINNHASHISSFYKNLNYSFHLLNLNLDYSLPLFENRSWKMYFLLGPTFSYNINTTAKGNGWNFYYQTQIDTNGNPVHILMTQNWEKNESNSKDLSKFNFGFDIGFNFVMPINNKLDFLLQNKYNIFFTSITRAPGQTSLLTGRLDVGLRYNLTH